MGETGHERSGAQRDAPGAQASGGQGTAGGLLGGALAGGAGRAAGERGLLCEQPVRNGYLCRNFGKRHRAAFHRQ